MHTSFLIKRNAFKISSCLAQRASATQASTSSDPQSRTTTYLGYLNNAFTALTPKFYKQATKGNNLDPQDHAMLKKISRSEVTARTKKLVTKLLHAENEQTLLTRLQELTDHILEFPPTRIVAVQNTGLPTFLLRLATANSSSDAIRQEVRQCLAVCGYVPRIRGRGINMLSIDGGGTRGMMGLEILDALERIAGKKVYQLFDHIVGVSTGAICAALLGVQKRSASEAREVYMEASRKVFSQFKIQGVAGLVWSHSYYETKRWAQLLRQILGDHETLIATSRDPTIPKLSLVSCIVNLPVLQPFIFRNYEPPAGRDSHYRGSAKHTIWQAVQASAAAPGYFEEVTIGDIILQDGGVFANNPSAIALHETRLLWPKEPLHCIVSLGNGRTVQDLEPAPVIKATSLQQKILRIVDSATDTEAVHMALHDLLPETSYFRLNPYMTFPYGLDEINPEKYANLPSLYACRLELMEKDAKLYVRRNMRKIARAAERLLDKPTPLQKIQNRIELYREKSGRATF